MGTTKEKLCYDLITIRPASEIADDSGLSLTQVGFWVDTTRMKMISQDIGKGRQVNPNTVQSITCLEVIQVDSSDCGCSVSGCNLLRTNLQLPSMIEVPNRTLLERVRSNIIGSPSISIIKYSRVPYASANELTRGIPKAFLYNRYIYLLSETLIDQITVDGVFEYPEELGNYHNCDSEPCYTPFGDYPISGRMIDDMKRIILDTNFKFMTNFSDQTNNSKNDFKPNITDGNT